MPKNDKKTRDIISSKAKLRWSDQIWVKKEMKRRKKMVKNGSYSKRQDVIRKQRTGKTWEQIYGEERAEEIKNKLSKTVKKNNPMSKKSVREKHLKIMQKLHKEGKIPYFKKGKDNVSYGIPRYPKPIFHDDLKHYTRSSWEEYVARLLVEHKIPYEYEKVKFKTDKETYTPDFTTENMVIEVKGPVYDWQIQKYQRFKNLITKRYVFLVEKYYVRIFKEWGFEAYDIHKPEIWLQEVK